MNELDLFTELSEDETRRETYDVPPALEGERLDKFLSEVTTLTRSAAARLIEEGNVLLEVLQGDVWKLATGGKNTKLPRNSRVTVAYPEPEESEALPEDIPLEILYEDEDVLVINKPSGMVVHPAPGNYTGTLVNALLYHCGDRLSGVGGVRRPGIVHRIDKDTSGLLVVAKNDRAHVALSDQLKTHTVSRVYRAIAIGNLREDSGTVSRPIARHPVDRKRMAVCTRPGEGRDAVTHYRVLERFGGFTLVECRLETGRTHQIRVHLSSLGHPLLGDPLYGGDGTRFETRHRALIRGQCLHAGELSLLHPTSRQKMTFSAPPPDEFHTILDILRKEAQQ